MPPDEPPAPTDSNFNYGFSAGIMEAVATLMLVTSESDDERERLATILEKSLERDFSGFRTLLGQRWVNGYRASFRHFIRILRRTGEL
jgi:hypothetical protein